MNIDIVVVYLQEDLNVRILFLRIMEKKFITCLTPTSSGKSKSNEPPYVKIQARFSIDENINDRSEFSVVSTFHSL